MFINHKSHNYSMHKGTILDMSEMIIIMFIAAVALFAVFYVLAEIETPLAEQGADTQYIDDAQGALEIFDMMMPFVLAGLVFAIIMGATMLDTHPAMFAFSIFLFIIMLILWMVFGNVFYYFSSDSTISSVRTDMAYTTIIFDNILFIGFVIGLIILIALYAKYKSGGGVGY